MNPNIPSPDLDPVALNERVSAAVRSHRIKLRVLTGVGFLFGFLAVAACVFFVWFYLIMYLPKQKTLLRDAEVAVQEHKSLSTEDAVKQIDKFLGAQIVLTHVTSMGTTMVAIVAGVLGLGTLILLTVGILNRRATLNQINASLAQISTQLRQLQDQGRTGSSAG